MGGIAGGSNGVMRELHPMPIPAPRRFKGVERLAADIAWRRRVDEARQGRLAARVTYHAPSPSPDHRRRHVVSGSVVPVGPRAHASSPLVAAAPPPMRTVIMHSCYGPGSHIMAPKRPKRRRRFSPPQPDDGGGVPSAAEAGDALLRELLKMYADGRSMSAYALTTIAYYAKHAGVQGPLQAYAMDPSKSNRTGHPARLVKKLVVELIDGVTPPDMTISIPGYRKKDKRRGDINLTVRAPHEMLHAEVFRTGHRLQDIHGRGWRWEVIVGYVGSCIIYIYMYRHNMV